MSVREFGLLRIPGSRKNDMSVLDKVGGEGIVANAFCFAKTRIFLNYRPSDPVSHPLLASHRKSTSILLKIVKNASGKTSSVVVCGFISREFYFPNPFDSQLISFNSIQIPRVTQLLESVPLEFIDNDEKLLPDTAPQTHSKIMDFQGAIPQPDIRKVVPRKQIKHFFVSNVLRLLFIARPIWSRKLLSSLPLLHEHSQMVACLLPYFAYFLSDGPWKGLWCRFGYDLRIATTIKLGHEEKIDYYPSRFLQSFEFRLQESDWLKVVESSTNLMECAKNDLNVILELDQMNWISRKDAFMIHNLRLANNMVKSTSQFVKIFKSSLKRQTCHQLCDVIDVSFCLELATAHVSIPINKRLGWFNIGAFELFKRAESQIILNRLAAANLVEEDGSLAQGHGFRTLSCFNKPEADVLDDFARWTRNLVHNDNECPDIFKDPDRDNEVAMLAIVNCVEALSAVYGYRRFVEGVYPAWSDSSMENEHSMFSFSDIKTETVNRSDVPVVTLLSESVIKKEVKEHQKKKKKAKKIIVIEDEPDSRQLAVKPKNPKKPTKTTTTKKKKKIADMVLDHAMVEQEEEVVAPQPDVMDQMMDDEQLEGGADVEVFDDGENDESKPDYFSFALEHGRNDMVVFQTEDDDDDDN